MHGDTYLRQAYDAIFRGDFESAIHCFQQAIEQEPDNASFYYKASITCARSGKLTLAAAYAKRAVELDPENLDYTLNSQSIEAKRLIAEARTLLEGEIPDPDQAKKLLSDADALDPLAVEAKLLLGLACRMQEDYRGAVAYFQDALRLDPQLAEAQRLLEQTRAEWRSWVRSQLRPTTIRNR
ncbi:tetratricopeptide repeat protein [Cohnella pontilimi]|uniref:Tetratricopeptide repeat protein n=1 Tax=Cohnella pontilimi TaxID=2564100 RepID=A0A4U0FL80_9BACL|nr:tetratricopeptide repeat protein [Cohnella pontilimi]TJY44322.1 tetratricopeptide repeat protein [Cohnella pontilimi]